MATAALAGGGPEVGGWVVGGLCVSARLQPRDGPASPQLNSNSCLLRRAIGRLYVVFPNLHYQKFNNSQSTLLLLMCVSVTNRPDERHIKRTTMCAKLKSSIMLDRVIKRNQLSKISEIETNDSLLVEIIPGRPAWT